MRARNIKPGLFKNDTLAELDPLARLLFIGLWCYADRDGLFEWRPKKIKAEILPYDDCDVERHLMSLHAMSFIEKYGNDNDGYFGRVIHFHEHQNPHPHEAKSKIPKPEQFQCHDISLTLQEMSVKCTADLMIPDSLIPDSLIPDTHQKTGALEESKKEKTDDFQTFWSAYPKKTAKKAAMTAWKKAKKDLPPIDKVLEAIERQKQSDQWRRDKGQFIPHPATWLNQGRWEDEPEMGMEGKANKLSRIPKFSPSDFNGKDKWELVYGE